MGRFNCLNGLIDEWFKNPHAFDRSIIGLIEFQGGDRADPTPGIMRANFSHALPHRSLYPQVAAPKIFSNSHGAKVNSFLTDLMFNFNWLMASLFLSLFDSRVDEKNFFLSILSGWLYGYFSVTVTVSKTLKNN